MTERKGTLMFTLRSILAISSSIIKIAQQIEIFWVMKTIHKSKLNNNIKEPDTFN